MIINTIGEGGCACGLYESDNLIAVTVCRKSGSSPDCSEGIAHKLTYRIKNDDGLKEIGELVHGMFGYGADCIVLIHNEELELPTDISE